MMRIRSALVALWIGMACACAPAAPEYLGTTYEELKPAEDFALTDQYGEPFRLADHRGKVVVLFFGYAHCPDVCPVTLSNWARVEEALAEEDGVEFVFVTVDPERDTVERIREHMEIFSDEFHGLTGTQAELEPVYKRFGIFHEKISFSESAIGYVVEHSTVMLLLDRQGRLRVTLPFDASPEDIFHDVRRLLES